MADTRTADVLVAGAGPVGLMTALELARHGLRPRVVDAAAGPATSSRALNLHARTLEILDTLGLAEELIGRGREIGAFERHVHGRPVVRHEFARQGRSTRFDFMLIVDQVITEEVLRRRLGEEGVSVEWSVRLESFTQDAEGVQVVLGDGGDGDGGRSARYGWLVGCDGAHSTVRRGLGIALEGTAIDTWTVADAQVRTELSTRAAHWLYGPEGATMMFPFPDDGKWRLVDTAAPSGATATATDVAARFARRLSEATGSEVAVESPTWVSTFTIQQRAAPRMQEGRCLVAGDAAHVHSPAGGQGMNTGLQDAVNLAWKLAAVVHGRADTRLLATYSDERVAVGRDLLGSTAAVTSYVTGAELVEESEKRLAEVGRTIIGAANGLAVAYGDSALTVPHGRHHAGDDAPRRPRCGERVAQVDAVRSTGAGWRALLGQLNGPEWLVLWCGSSAPAVPPSFPAWGRTFALDDVDLIADLDLGEGDWMLVRPDGYLSARGVAGMPVPLPVGYTAAEPGGA